MNWCLSTFVSAGFHAVFELGLVFEPSHLAWSFEQVAELFLQLIPVIYKQLVIIHRKFETYIYYSDCHSYVSCTTSFSKFSMLSIGLVHGYMGWFPHHVMFAFELHRVVSSLQNSVGFHFNVGLIYSFPIFLR